MLEAQLPVGNASETRIDGRLSDALSPGADFGGCGPPPEPRGLPRLGNGLPDDHEATYLEQCLLIVLAVK